MSPIFFYKKELFLCMLAKKYPLKCTNIQVCVWTILTNFKNKLYNKVFICYNKNDEEVAYF